MTTLVVLGAVVLLLAAAGLVWPLWRVSTSVASDERLQLEDARDRLLQQLREMELEEADRNLDPETSGVERRRIERELARTLRDLEGGGDVGAPMTAQVPQRGDSPPRTMNRMVPVLVIGILVPAAAAVLYGAHQRGVPTALSPSQEVPASQTAPMAAGGAPDVGAMVAKLEERLRNEPDNADGWAMLGRSYAVLGQMDKARAAASQAYKLAPERPEIIALYAGILYQMDPSNTRGPAQPLYAKLHALQPENADALWFLGFSAFEDKRYRDAVRYWEKLIAIISPDDPSADHVKKALEKARSMR